MAWTTCDFDRTTVNQAAQKLMGLPPDTQDRDALIEIVSDWRASHAYSLQVVKMTLKKRARSVNPAAMVAQRLKRLPSILLKLSQQRTLKLTQMQDIGGCRAIMGSVKEVRTLALKYQQARAKNPVSRNNVIKVNDYLTTPKPDGYRSLHLVVLCSSPSRPEFTGQKIEIQLRTRLQHAWATAVETCQAFTGRAMKSKIKDAEPSWLRFFALASSQMASKERSPIVTDTPATAKDRLDEMAEIDRKEKILDKLVAWSQAIDISARSGDGSFAFLLDLNTQTRRLAVRAYAEEDVPLAQADYLAREKESEGDFHRQVVLVSASSLATLRKAYPNYYMDTSGFVDFTKKAIDNRE